MANPINSYLTPVTLYNKKLDNFEARLASDGIEEKQPVTHAEMDIVRNAIRRFSFEFSRKLSASGKNYCFAPISIISVVGMVLKALPYYNASKQNLLKSLHLDNIPETRVHAALGELAFQCQLTEKDGAELSVANAMIQNLNICPPPNEHYLASMRETYHSEHFGTDQDNLVEKVNSWVSEKTKGMIPTILSPNDAEDLAIALMNAVYFEGKWLKEFDESKTNASPFTCIDGKTENVMMMHKNSTLDYYSDDLISMVKLPYKGNADLSYCIFLPNPGVDLAKIECTLSSDIISKCLKDALQKSVNLHMPKVNLDTKIETVKEMLEEMGMPLDESLFNIAFTDLLTLTCIKHSAKMIVDEKGTKAAAVTSGMVTATSFIEPEEFRVNRPHMVLIMKGNDILFQASIKDASCLVKAGEGDPLEFAGKSYTIYITEPRVKTLERSGADMSRADLIEYLDGTKGDLFEYYGFLKATKEENAYPFLHPASSNICFKYELKNKTPKDLEEEIRSDLAGWVMNLPEPLIK